MLIENPGSRHFEHLLHLRKVDVIGSLPAADLGLLAEYGRERFFPKGAFLLHEGEPVTCLHCIVAGRVHLSRQGRPVGRAGPGAGVGGLGLLARDEHGVNAVAETDTVTIAFDADSLLETFEDRFAIFHHVLRELCRRVVHRLQRERPAIEGDGHQQRAPMASEEPLDLVERIVLLRRSAPFTHSSLSALAELARGLHEVSYAPGELLWRRGEPWNGALLLLADGVVDCTGDVYRQQARRGVPLGSVEALAEEPRWYDAVAATPVLALRGHSSEMLDVLEDNVDMGLDLLASVARGLLRLAESDECSGGGTLGRFYGCEALPAPE